MRLILVRHGQTPSNTAGALDTAIPGADLTELGRQQAAALARALGDQPIGALFASTLVRTQQTAAPLGDRLGLPTVVLDGLREVEAGEIEMRTDKESQRLYLDTAFAWADDDLDARIPGAESGAEFFARYDAAIGIVHASGVETAVAVSHGAAIRTWVSSRAENADAMVGRENPLLNTGSIVLEGSPSAGWRVLSWQRDPLKGPIATADADPTGAGVA